MLKLTEEVRTKNFFHLQVGGVYRGRRLMSKQLTPEGMVLQWCRLLRGDKLETI